MTLIPYAWKKKAADSPLTGAPVADGTDLIVGVGTDTSSVVLEGSARLIETDHFASGEWVLAPQSVASHTIADAEEYVVGPDFEITDTLTIEGSGQLVVVEDLIA